jgi:glycosyltransferase involved in cell wall biosynthesis
VSSKTIRVLTLIENATVTGPARNVIEFGKMAAHAEEDLPAVEVTLVTYQRGAEASALAKAAKEAGLAVSTIAERRRWDTSVLGQLKRVVTEINPDILETRNVKSHFLVRLTRLHRKYPWIAWNHGYTTTSRLDELYTRLDKWSLKGAYRVVTVCQPFANHLAKLGVRKNKITILHNSVKPFVEPHAEEVERTWRKLGIADDEAIILSVGRLSQEKGHADLIRAAAILSGLPEAPRFRVAIVGDGPEREPLSRLALELGVQQRIKFAGFQREMGPYYAMATVLAVPSHSEGSPNVVLEAMAAGLPIVANEVGGIPEILEQDATGLMVTPRSPDAMARAILRVLTDDELRERIAATAKECAATEYTPQAYRRALVEFYQSTVASRGK